LLADLGQQCRHAVIGGGKLCLQGFNPRRHLLVIGKRRRRLGQLGVIPVARATTAAITTTALSSTASSLTTKATTLATKATALTTKATTLATASETPS